MSHFCSWCFNTWITIYDARLHIIQHLFRDYDWEYISFMVSLHIYIMKNSWAYHATYSLGDVKLNQSLFICWYHSIAQRLIIYEISIVERYVTLFYTIMTYHRVMLYVKHRRNIPLLWLLFLLRLIMKYCIVINYKCKGD